MNKYNEMNTTVHNYYEFYKKYKKPSALQSNIFVNYKEFS